MRRRVSGSECYVAFGDSMIIDYYAGGPGWGAASLLYKNLDDVYPDWKGRDLATLYPGIRFHDLTSDGATTDTVLSWQLPKAPTVENQPTIIILTVGGNDILHQYGVPEKKGITLSYEMKGRLLKIISYLQDSVRFPKPARIYIGNIYDPSDGMGNLEKEGYSRWPDGLKVLDHWNKRIEEVAREKGLTLVDVHRHFLGHGVNYDDPSGKHYDPEDNTSWLWQVIEPNSRGAHEIRKLFWEKIYEDSLK
ncbi:MAG: SGNH/GDSL hydrolase family protein [Candidatus Jordarchaeum sp.]|uniref:SGNH/GDSL hydrolase family protein n=1 Tax=Candidatus Jordarchaeum sp. TaxID=2823881 RepID=UPI00404B8E84